MKKGYKIDIIYHIILSFMKALWYFHNIQNYKKESFKTDYAI